MRKSLLPPTRRAWAFACSRVTIRKCIGAAAAVIPLLFSALTLDAVILYRTGDPAANTSEPTGTLAGSGWNCQGTFGGFLGTAIAPEFFVTADHIGMQSDVFVYQGKSYSIIASIKDPESDLRIYQVSEPFPSFAPLYTATNENGKQLVAFGKGTQRGEPIITNGVLNGWRWGAWDSVQRWGQNVVDQADERYIRAAFNQNGLTNEAHLTGGDSGGGIFINDNGIWKLAGIAYAVSGPFFTETETVDAAIFDERGLYSSSARTTVVTGSSPKPSYFYATRISQRITWINSIIYPNGVPEPTPTPTPSTTPAPISKRSSAFVSQSVPTSMTTGESYVVSVTMRNTGSNTWTSSGKYRLGSQNPQNTTRWGLGRANLPAGVTVPYGASHTFTFTVSAPSSPGNYNFQWKTVQDGVGWFGATTPNVSVSVISNATDSQVTPSPTASPTPTPSATPTITPTPTPSDSATPEPTPKPRVGVEQ